MEPSDPRHTASLLGRMRAGDAAAEEDLLAHLYAELHALAERGMRRERADHTLQPTALVHEAWLRIARGADTPVWEGRGHFLAVAAQAMRRVLVDHARRRAADKRGADAARVELDDAVFGAVFGAVAGADVRAFDVLALDEALESLSRRDAELARVVELRFFGGLTAAETGAVLGLGVRQVEGAWVTARGWLHRELGPKGAR
jgi:RNA polymerase sigma factor (TIGR02999 family)